MQPLNQIVCPIDFSPISDHALEVAMRMSRKLALPLKLVYVVQPLPVFAADPEIALALMPLATLPDEQQRVNAAQDMLRPLVERLSAQDVKVTGEVLTGDAGQVLGELLEQQPQTLTVMGTHGYSSVKRFILGSATVTVLRHAMGPVMTVREAHPDVPVLKVGVAVDFSSACEPAIRTGAWLAEQWGAELHLLHVSTPLELMVPSESQVPMYFEEARRAVDAAVEQRLEGIAKALPTLTVVFRLLPGVSPARALAGDATQNGLNVMVMGTHGRSGLERLFLGSVTERTLQLAPCPVISVKSVEPTP